MAEPSFEKSVFINCPFDEQYEGMLQAMLFCVVYLGFQPRLATERTDSAENRLSKIVELVDAAKYSIHDLSRSEAKKAGEHFRLNMPFELGLDYGCRRFSEKHRDKKILILEERRFQLKPALSDLAGCDFEPHAGDTQRAVRAVANWLVSEAGARNTGSTEIMARYADFGEWYYERQVAAGYSDEDIQHYPTRELLKAMNKWVEAGQPL